MTSCAFVGYKEENTYICQVCDEIIFEPKLEDEKEIDY